MSAAEPDAEEVGAAIVALGKASLDAGNRHEYNHALAALRAGDSTNCTPSRCVLDPTPAEPDPGAGERRFNLDGLTTTGGSFAAAEPDAGDVEALAEALGVDPRLIVKWPWSTASPGRYLRTETVLDLLAAVRREAEVRALTEAADWLAGEPHRGARTDLGQPVVPMLRDRAARLGGA